MENRRPSLSVCKYWVEWRPWVAGLVSIPQVCQSLRVVNNSPKGNVQPNTICTRSPIKSHWSPLMKNKHIKFCLFSERTASIMPLSRGDKRASVCERNSSPFSMSISISAGELFEWNFLNGAHSFHSSASRGNAARNSTALPPWVPVVIPQVVAPCLTTAGHLNKSETEWLQLCHPLILWRGMCLWCKIVGETLHFKSDFPHWNAPFPHTRLYVAASEKCGSRDQDANAKEGYIILTIEDNLRYSKQVKYATVVFIKYQFHTANSI